MHIVMIGTRGVPARYGGFETAVEQVGRRLVEAGHEVTVFCRDPEGGDGHLGMRRIYLPSVRHKVAETLSHTALSVLHKAARNAHAALVFNAANAPLLPVLRAWNVPSAVHVDGLEWRRSKWGPVGRRYYLLNERLSVALADRLIADAKGIQDYYRERYEADTTLIAYGSSRPDAAALQRLQGLGLSPQQYHLVVARLEPENHVDVILGGYKQSSAQRPLVIVGSAPYSSAHVRNIEREAVGDPRIRLLGPVWDQDVLDGLYLGACTYLHGHSVGGTNPSLLRAMGAGAPTAAFDVNFNREVLGDTGEYWHSPAEVSHLVGVAESDPGGVAERGRRGQQRALARYDWDAVAKQYEQLCVDLVMSGGRPARTKVPGQ